MSCKRFLYAIVSLVLLMHTVAAQSPGTTVAQALVTAAENAGYSIDSSQIQTIPLPNGGGSVANYPLAASVNASNLPNAGIPVALQYWASSNLNGFVVVYLTSVSQQVLQFTLLNGTNNNIIVGTQTVPTTANQNPVRRDVIIFAGTLCVTIFGYTFCISWIIIIITPVVPPPAVAPQTVAPLPVAANLN